MQEQTSSVQGQALRISGNPFTVPGSWYRGNTHTHSVASDGKMTVAELADWYEQHSYDFLCITDHNVVAELDQASGSSIVLIPGAEIMVQCDQAFAGEICALGIESVKRTSVPAQLIIDDVLAQGGVPIMSHPHQSGMYSSLMMELEGLLGIEVFNAHCYGTGRRGFSLAQWDELLTIGKRTLGIAADDQHTRAKEYNSTCQPGFDQGKAWVMVRTQDRSGRAILEAMAKGMFYSTTGPEIHDIQITGGDIHVRTSPVKSIRFATIPWLGATTVAKGNEFLTEARIPLTSVGTPDKCRQLVESGIRQGWLSKPVKPGSYFRVECWDGQEGWAWSNPVFFES